MSRRLSQILLVAGLLLVLPATLLLADHTSSAINITPLLLTNQTGADDTGVAAPFNLSGQSLLDAGFINSNALNSAVEESGSRIPHMPASLSQSLLAAWNNAGVEETTAANNATANDLTLPAANAEVYEFAFQHASRIMRLNLGTVGVADWTVTWEYYNGSSYVALSGVSDGSVGFTSGPVSNISWDVPTDWPRATLHGQAAYWIRARVSAFTSLATAPLGTQAWHETGRWWVFSESINDGEQRSYDLFTGGADLSTFHYYFPGPSGIVTTNYGGRLAPDDGIEAFEVKGWIDTTQVGSDIIHKEGAVRVWVSAANEITFQVSGTRVERFIAESTDGQAVKNDFTPSYSGAHDALVGDSWGDTGVSLFVGQLFPSSLAYTIYRALISFDTSSLPDNPTIHSVRLLVSGGGDGPDDLIVQHGAGAGPAPWDANAYNKNLYPGPILGTIPDTGPIGALGLYQNIELNDPTTITTTGSTVFVLRSQNDFDNVAPTDTSLNGERWTLGSSTGARPPILEVVYDGAQSVTATGITPGEYTLRVRQDLYGSTSLAIDLDGVQQVTGASTTPITGNSSTWNFLTGSSVVYSESVTASMVANRVVNPGFESNLDNWTQDITPGMTATITRETNASQFGVGSARIEVPVGAVAGNAILYYEEAAAAGDTYTGSMWTYAATAAEASVLTDMFCVDGAGVNISGASTITLSPGPGFARQTHAPITCPATTAGVRLRALAGVDPAGGTATLYVDGALLQEASEIDRLDLEYQLVAPPALNFPDTSGNGFVSTSIDLPNAPSGYTQSILPTGPNNPVIAIDPTTAITGAVAAVGPIDNFTTAATGSATQWFVLAEVTRAVEDAGYPAELLLVPLGIALCIGAGLLGSRVFHSVWMSYMLIMFTLASLWQWGGWPYYPMILFAFPGLVFLWWKREKAG